MRRRDVLALGLCAPLWSVRAHAQHNERVRRIAVLTRIGQGLDDEKEASRPWVEWRDELRRLGYVEDNNLLVDRHVVEGGRDRFREIAKEIVKRRPDAIFAPTQSAVAALIEETESIPVVTVVVDPVGSGFATSLARPGRNITGFSVDAGLETLAKRFALLREIAPTCSRLACVTPGFIWDGRIGEAVRDAGRQAGVTVIGALLHDGTEAEYRRAFAQMATQGADCFYVSIGLEHIRHRHLIAELGDATGLPGVHFHRELVEVGGLISYGSNISQLFRGAAGYVDRILKGIPPSDLPFQQPTSFELVINLRTAKTLRLEVSPSLLARADEVIE
jgi:putative ABC transport system substrate-binding protein